MINMDYSKFEDVMGQILFARTYIQLSFCFPLQNERRDEVIEELRRAARKLGADIPYLNGQVVQVNETEDSTGICRIAPYEPHEQDTFLRVQDVAELDYETIIKTKGPFKYFDSRLVAPRDPTFAPYDPAAGPAPVFILQANFIFDGIILTFAGQHSVLDMNGYAKCIEYFAKALNGDNMTSAELTAALCDRRNIYPPLKEGQKGEDLSRWSEILPMPEAIECTCVTWHFTAAALAELKAEINSQCVFKDGVKYLTTNDAITALWWKSLTSIRADRFAPDEKVTCGRTIDLRKCREPPVSPLYLGQSVGTTYSDSTVREVVEGPLWKSAFLLRRAVNAVDDTYCRSLSSLVAETADLTKLSPMRCMDLSKDAGITSWVSHPLQSLRFGKILGLSTLVRVPRIAPIPSLVVILPHTRDNGYDVSMSLEKDLIPKMKTHADWAGRCEYIG